MRGLNKSMKGNKNVILLGIIWIFGITSVASYLKIFDATKILPTRVAKNGFDKELRTRENIIEQPRNKYLHFLSQEEPYHTRMAGIQQQCSNMQARSRILIRTKTMKYNDKIKTGMCEIPKVASTSWQKLMLKLGGHTDEVTKTMVDHGTIANKHFDQLKTDEEARTKMKEYLTFLVTRHPFERLVSAHHDKFSDKDPYDFYRMGIGRHIARSQAVFHKHGINNAAKLTGNINIIKNSSDFLNLTKDQKDDVLKYSEIIRTGKISFSQFIKYILSFNTPAKVNSMDIHWRPQTNLCMPCAFNYSYVIRFDNLAIESNRLIDYLQTHHNASTSGITRFPKRIPSVKQNSTVNAFKEISEKDVESLRKIYYDDFRIFDYDPNLYQGHT